MKHYLSNYSREMKKCWFLQEIERDARVLEIGGADSWLGHYLKENGWNDYTNLDIVPPADIVGDILRWRQLGLKAGSYDAIVAFEVVEHVDCFKVCWDLLKPGGKMMITTPVPHTDWLLRGLEIIGLNQKRTSQHVNLVYLKDVSYFKSKEIKMVAGLSQWAIFTK